MTDCVLTNIKPANRDIISEGLFLLIINATIVPPHIALSVNGKLFSLGINGPTVGKNINTLLTYIQKHRIDTLFVKLTLPNFISINRIEEEVSKIMVLYDRLEAGKISCLNPIKDFCTNSFNISLNDVRFVFELLPELEKKSIYKETYHLNMERLLYNDCFRLLKYSQHEIDERIFDVQKRNRTTELIY
jgi:hypothetical protein